MINFPGYIVHPSGVTKFFQIRSIQRFDISDTDISDFIIECFSQGKSYISMINFIFCIVLPPGASEFYQTNKFEDFLDLTQFFQI